MTNYLLVQTLNIAILAGFGLLLVYRTRADFRRRAAALTSEAAGDTSAERRKRELRTGIEALQRELRALESAADRAAPPADGVTR